MQMLLAASAGGGAQLVNPELLSFNFVHLPSGSIVSDSINPGDGALIRVIVRHRDLTSSKTHTVPTTTLSNLFDFGAGAKFQQLWTIESVSAFPVYLRTTEFWGYATGATGAGTITAGFSEVPWNASIEVIRYASGWASAPNGLQDTSKHDVTTESSLAFDFPGTPAAASAAIIAMINNADNINRALPAGWTSLTNFSSSFHHAISAFKRGSVGAGPHTVTGMDAADKAGGITETKAA